MARINKAELTRCEIIRVASAKFLEQGFSNTSVKNIADELSMSTGNVTFYYPTKEHMLSVLVEMLCDFQWKMIKEITEEGNTALLAVCLELTAMASMCEENEIVKDFYLSSYSHPMTLEIIRRNDTKKVIEVFKPFKEDWTDEQFIEAETLISGIEYATLMTTGDSAPLDIRIRGALNNIMKIFGVPKETREDKLTKVFKLDYRKIGHNVMNEFIKYVKKTNEQTIKALLKG